MWRREEARERELKLKKGGLPHFMTGGYCSDIYVCCTNLDIKIILNLILGIVIILNSFNISPNIRPAEYFDKFL